MPHLSILIPCQGDSDEFEDTLASVLQNRPADSEVLVVYPGTYRDPYDLRGEVDFVETPPGATLLDLIKTGFERADGAIVHLLQCGVEVGEGWTIAAIRHFDDPSVAAVSPQLVLKQQDAEKTIAGVSYSATGVRRIRRMQPAQDPDTQVRTAILGPTLAAGFYRTEAIREVGGVDVKIGEQFADIDLALSLRKAGYRALPEPASQVYGFHPIERDRNVVEARREERLFWKHLSRQRWLRSVVLHSFVVTADFLFPYPRPRGLLRLVGRTYSCVEAMLRYALGRSASTTDTIPVRASNSPAFSQEITLSEPPTPVANSKRHVA